MIHNVLARLFLFTYLFHVVIECDAHAFFTAKHLTGHKGVEDSCAGQGEAEVEAKQPPIFHILVELEKNRDPVIKCPSIDKRCRFNVALSLHCTECVLHYIFVTVVSYQRTDINPPVNTYTVQRGRTK